MDNLGQAIWQGLCLGAGAGLVVGILLIAVSAA